MTNKQILLVSRPAGEPTGDNFRLVEAPVPALADGQVLVKHHYLSLDPYMRGRMNDAKSYAPPQPLERPPRRLDRRVDRGPRHVRREPSSGPTRP